MNGDGFSHRGMGPSDGLPRIRKHEDAGRESGRYGSSRDHFVSFGRAGTALEFIANHDL